VPISGIACANLDTSQMIFLVKHAVPICSHLWRAPVTTEQGENMGRVQSKVKAIINEQMTRAPTVKSTMQQASTNTTQMMTSIPHHNGLICSSCCLVCCSTAYHFIICFLMMVAVGLYSCSRGGDNRVVYLEANYYKNSNKICLHA